MAVKKGGLKFGKAHTGQKCTLLFIIDFIIDLILKKKNFLILFTIISGFRVRIYESEFQFHLFLFRL